MLVSVPKATMSVAPIDRMMRSTGNRMFQCERAWRAPRHLSALRQAMKTTRYLLALMSVFSFLLGGCGRQSSSQNPAAPGAPIVKVAVFADGHITADGQPATLDSLRESFKTLAAQKGVVWYYRETGHSEPPPQAMEVMKAVIAARLPIRLSSRPDYSDAIGIDGKPLH